MRSLETIRAQNRAPGVGDKLGCHSGSPRSLNISGLYERCRSREILRELIGPAHDREPA